MLIFYSSRSFGNPKDRGYDNIAIANMVKTFRVSGAIAIRQFAARVFANNGYRCPKRINYGYRCQYANSCWYLSGAVNSCLGMPF